MCVILGFVMCVFGPPMKGTWWPLSLAKFGWNRYRSFYDMQVLIFCEFGLKMPIHAPKMGVFGDLTS